MGVYRPRQLSLSNSALNAHSLSAGSLPSPRPRGSGGVDGVMGESWVRRKTGDRETPTSTEANAPDAPLEPHTASGNARNEDSANIDDTQPETSTAPADSPHSFRNPELHPPPSPGQPTTQSSRPASGIDPSSTFSESVNPVNSHDPPDSYASGLGRVLPPQATLHTPTTFSNESVQWRYKDHNGLIQGAHPHLSPTARQVRS